MDDTRRYNAHLQVVYPPIPHPGLNFEKHNSSWTQIIFFFSSPVSMAKSELLPLENVFLGPGSWFEMQTLKYFHFLSSKLRAKSFLKWSIWLYCILFRTDAEIAHDQRGISLWKQTHLYTHGPSTKGSSPLFFFISHISAQCKIYLFLVQAYLKDIAGLVPHHRNTSSLVIKWVVIFSLVEGPDLNL